jgi:hypothetical protein
MLLDRLLLHQEVMVMAGVPREKKAAQILAAALGAISPHMRRSFVDRKYSPSTSMDRSEWEIILEDLLIWVKLQKGSRIVTVVNDKASLLIVFGCLDVSLRKIVQ